MKLAGNDNSISFYDLNAKLNYKINENNRMLSLQEYFGKDNMNLVIFSVAMVYGNSFIHLRWNHNFSSSVIIFQCIDHLQ